MKSSIRHLAVAVVLVSSIAGCGAESSGETTEDQASPEVLEAAEVWKQHMLASGAASDESLAGLLDAPVIELQPLEDDDLVDKAAGIDPAMSISSSQATPLLWVALGNSRGGWYGVFALRNVRAGQTNYNPLSAATGGPVTGLVGNIAAQASSNSVFVNWITSQEIAGSSVRRNTCTFRKTAVRGSWSFASGC